MTNFRDLMPARADTVAAAAARAELDEQLRRYGGGLAEIRSIRGVTQQTLAAELDVSQAQVSRIEAARDPLFSSIAKYLDALGGDLKLVAVFEDAEYDVDLGNPLLPEASRASGGRSSRPPGRTTTKKAAAGMKTTSKSSAKSGRYTSTRTKKKRATS